ncbi:protein-tyrosine-phosphatase [Paraburkholderia sp. GAS82]|jgi:protein-tyrosine phosphatase|uniref:arsenate reductase/protein-tyrosine-phosphatase family protein n=1 Tax=Paraburkholderia sp. GAS82 TaxID=3035137 RepID=UPI003D1D5460
MNTILVICTANVCCGPMAQGLLTRALPGTRVLSGGLFVVEGASPNGEAVDLMDSEGLDIRHHRAHAVTPWMIDAATFILVMTSRQKLTIERRFPPAYGKTFRLLEEGDVPEPCMNGRAHHAAALLDIREGAERWAWHMSRLKMEAAYLEAIYDV